MSDEDLGAIAKAAIDGATSKFAGKNYAVVVVIREIAGTRVQAAGNMKAGREAMIRVLQETLDGLRGSRIIV